MSDDSIAVGQSARLQETPLLPPSELRMDRKREYRLLRRSQAKGSDLAAQGKHASWYQRWITS